MCFELYKTYRVFDNLAKDLMVAMLHYNNFTAISNESQYIISYLFVRTCLIY